jgi:hypothetical protein
MPATNSSAITVSQPLALLIPTYDCSKEENDPFRQIAKRTQFLRSLNSSLAGSELLLDPAPVLDGRFVTAIEDHDLSGRSEMCEIRMARTARAPPSIGSSVLTSAKRNHGNARPIRAHHNLQCSRWLQLRIGRRSSLSRNWRESVAASRRKLIPPPRCSDRSAERRWSRSRQHVSGAAQAAPAARRA